VSETGQSKQLASRVSSPHQVADTPPLLGGRGEGETALAASVRTSASGGSGSEQGSREVVLVLQYHEPPGFTALVHGWCPWDLLGSGFRDPRDERVARLRQAGDAFALISQGKVLADAAGTTAAAAPSTTTATPRSTTATGTSSTTSVAGQGTTTTTAVATTAGTACAAATSARTNGPVSVGPERHSPSPTIHESHSERNLSLFFAAILDGDEEDDESDIHGSRGEEMHVARRRKESSGSIGSWSERSGSDASTATVFGSTHGGVLAALEADDNGDDDDGGGGDQQGRIDAVCKAPVESAFSLQPNSPVKASDGLVAPRSNLVHTTSPIFCRLRKKKNHE